jgi:uncharacterized protein YjdB
MSRNIRSLIGFLMVLLVSAACSDSPTEMPDLRVAVVEVSPNHNTLTVGDTMVLRAFPKTSSGDILGSVAVAWSSANSTIAQITPRGHNSVVRAQAPGDVQITATSEGKAGRVTITVVAAPLVVNSVEIAGGADSIAIGGQLRFDAIVRAADGTVIGGRNVAWHVSNPQLVTFAGASDGSFIIATAHAAGTVTFTATVEGKQVQRVLSVKPTPQAAVAFIRFEPQLGIVTLFTDATHQLRVRAFAADSSELLGRAVTWSSSDNAIATVSTTGLVTARGVGAADITANVDGKTTQIAIDARSHIARIDMNPASLVLGVYEHAQINATPKNADGGVLQRNIMWTSTNEAVAIVDADGNVTARGAGDATIKATAEGQEGVTSVRVVEWATNTLSAVGDSALPVTLFTRTNGTRVTARGGQFKMIMTGVNTGRYELLIDATLEAPGGGSYFGTLGYNGTWQYNVVTGEFVLTSYSGITATAKRGADMSLTVIGRMEADTPELTLKFAGN